MSHSDEAGPALADIEKLFGSKPCCHQLEEPAVRKVTPVDCTFDKRETRLGNIEVIPTPGHTPGGVCFLAGSTDGKTSLFTGDTLFLNKGAWDTRVNAGGSKSDLKNSLMLLRDLKPAVVLSSASVGSVPSKEVSAEEWQADIDKVLHALSKGISLSKPKIRCNRKWRMPLVTASTGYRMLRRSTSQPEQPRSRS